MAVSCGCSLSPDCSCKQPARGSGTVIRPVFPKDCVPPGCPGCHDRFLTGVRADVCRAGAAGGGSGQGEDPECDGWQGRLGAGIVVCDDPTVVGRSAPEQVRVQGGRVLWAAEARCLLTPPDRPPGALALTEAEARQLRAAGVDAVSLLSCGAGGRRQVNATHPGDEAPDAPRRVVVLVDGLHVPRLGEVLAAVSHAFAGPAGPPLIDVLPEVPVPVGEQSAAPAHPWVRSRLLGTASAVVALGHAPVLDLGLAEAGAHGVPGVRVLLAEPQGLPAVAAGPGVPAATGPLADLLRPALPGHLRLFAPDIPVVTGPVVTGTGPVPGYAAGGAAAVVAAPPVLRAWLERLAAGAPARAAAPSRSTSAY
jgi:hypothetical protein